MTVADYMDSCDGAIRNTDGCKLNYEKACINGIEVDLMESNIVGGTFKDGGFDSHPSNALTKSYFSDPTKMYNTVSTPGGTSIHLCTKIDGVTDQNIRSLNLGNLPTDKDYVIESTPAFIKPGLDVGGTSFHWKVSVSHGQVSMEAEIQNSSQIDGPREVGSQKRTDLARVTGNSLNDVFGKLFAENLVRCKKSSTFTDHPEVTTYYKRASDFPEPLRQSYAQDYQRILTAIAPSGVDKASLTRSFNRVFNVNLPVNDASDDEPTKGVPKTGKSRSRN